MKRDADIHKGRYANVVLTGDTSIVQVILSA